MQAFEYADGARFEGETAATAAPGVFLQHGHGSKVPPRPRGAAAAAHARGARACARACALKNAPDLRAVLLSGCGAGQVWPSGDRYEGEFREGRREGTGVMTWANGDRYEGGWRRGEPHLSGVFREEGRAFAVWHNDGARESAAPMARFPAVATDAATLAVSAGGRKLRYHGAPSFNTEAADAATPAFDHTLLTGWRDGADFARDYAKAVRRRARRPRAACAPPARLARRLTRRAVAGAGGVRTAVRSGRRGGCARVAREPYVGVPRRAGRAQLVARLGPLGCSGRCGQRRGAGARAGARAQGGVASQHRAEGQQGRDVRRTGGGDKRALPK